MRASRALLHGHGCVRRGCSSTALGVRVPRAPPGLRALPPSVFLYSRGCTHPVRSSAAAGACPTHAFPLRRLIPHRILLYSYVCSAVLLRGCGHSQPAQSPVTVSARYSSTAVCDPTLLASPQLWAIPPCSLLHSCGCVLPRSRGAPTPSPSPWPRALVPLVPFPASTCPQRSLHSRGRASPAAVPPTLVGAPPPCALLRGGARPPPAHTRLRALRLPGNPPPPTRASLHARRALPRPPTALGAGGPPAAGGAGQGRAGQSRARQGKAGQGEGGGRRPPPPAAL